MQQQTVYDRYKKEIYRIGWRLQYRARKMKQREGATDQIERYGTTFTESADDKMLVEQLLDQLPQNGRALMDMLYMQGQTEKEVAGKLNMSQQGVNKWKQKMIRQLSETANSQRY
ncbi:hypothetical protein GCM10010912_09340 [Paenibacillus albidus]|uniref:RNA polymerase sigma factor 70 region 4 type 2 domain-containing protein n=1 Tax=Paenibacillus albidus TaxID=2041023 RepID=A0A917C0K4_9BACL|nr:sigma factor-like helix-turn-helix DNA-binding protein [Paenibacillus albidus]GGF66490.1 hypothetical protein GCM10010912_09340 [Paenibacillus albidus]